MKGIFFISNGYGEDTISAAIVNAVHVLSPRTPLFALPLVGNGTAYRKAPCEIVGPGTVMPSGGVIPGNPGNLIKDFRSGLLKLTWRQLSVIGEISPRSSAVVTVGDIYPALLAVLRGNRPRIMVGTAKSDYFVAYNGFETFIMKKWFEEVFVRDEPTALSLRGRGVQASWPGNVMMDCLEEENARFPLSENSRTVALLPGSRASAFLDMPVLAESAEILSEKLSGDVRFLAGIALSIDSRALARALSEKGWGFREGKTAAWGRYDFIEKKGVSILLVRGAFGDVLRKSVLVIGQAGTGNEQAVGLGKPVVTFDTFEKKGMGWYRKRQKGLLGDSISVVKRDAESIAGEAFDILRDRSRYEAMAEIGKHRMGPPGGAAKIAASVLKRATV